ncbi:MAG: 23S rRNA (uracil(1939)-C(5))-methyltransferase RlmD, partial [Candidatus Melainabacteria bacterium HGW-Melainabacteria-1]
KREHLIETLSSMGGWDAARLQTICAPVAGMTDPWHYRNKGQFPFQMLNGKLEAGFYAPRSHKLVPIDHCLIHHQTINEILSWTVAAARQAGLQAYNENTRQGALRHLIVRHGFKTNQTLVAFVTRAKDVPGLAGIASRLMLAFPSVVGVVQNLNPKAGNRILGDQTLSLAGSTSYLDNIAELRFEVSLPSFFQVNPLQTEVLYATAAELADVGPDETVLDAYSGAGTISLWLARHGHKVNGIEVVATATADAERNAALNQIEQASFITAKVEDCLPSLLGQLHKPPVLILDPPRKGCEPQVLDAVASSGITQVVYVSCNPATLARDSARLKAAGFQLDALRPVDMFPHTHHLETVARFCR